VKGANPLIGSVGAAGAWLKASRSNHRNSMRPKSPGRSFGWPPPCGWSLTQPRSARGDSLCRDAPIQAWYEAEEFYLTPAGISRHQSLLTGSDNFLKTTPP